MPLAEDNDVVRHSRRRLPIISLDVGILPRTPWSGEHFFYAHALHPRSRPFRTLAAGFPRTIVGSAEHVLKFLAQFPDNL